MQQVGRKRLRIKQKVFKTVYPALLKAGKVFGLKAGVERNKQGVKPSASFYSLKTTANNGSEFSFDSLKGKKVLVVNTASFCGYTPQLSELKWLSDWYKDTLQIVGFPSNDFKEQEKGSDEEIATFCIGTYGIRFPLMRKSRVIKSDEQNPVFAWLTNKNKNGWNDKDPTWNFTKYFIDEKGILTHVFEAGVSPVSKVIVDALK